MDFVKYACNTKEQVDGRNAIYLSKNGYSVDAIDFSEIALDGILYGQLL